MITSNEILNILKKDDRNYIAAWHRATKNGRRDSSTSGVTMNYYSEYHASLFADIAMQSFYVPFLRVEEIMDLLDAEEWGDGAIGGTEYRLKPEYRAG